MAKKLNDNKGSFNPNRKMDDFSKAFLIRFVRELQSQLLKMAEFSQNLVEEQWGAEKAKEHELALWIKFAKACRPRSARLAGIELPAKDLYDVFKVYQLIPDSIASDIYQAKFDFKSPYHLVWTIQRCKTLEVYEKKGQNERIKNLCLSIEWPEIQADLETLCPGVKVNCLKLPPRASKDDSACVWEAIMPEPKKKR